MLRRALSGKEEEEVALHRTRLRARKSLRRIICWWPRYIQLPFTAPGAGGHAGCVRSPKEVGRPNVLPHFVRGPGLLFS